MYATGAPTSLSDFLNSLATFAATAGWTVDHNAVYTSGDYWLAVHKNACYLHYYVPPPVSGLSFIELFGATGYNGSLAPSAQPGSNAGLFSLLYPPPPGPYTAYHFFSSNAGGVDYLHSILEYSANNFMHIHGGVLNAVGGASPAIYTAGTQWSAIAGGGSAGDAGPAAGNYTPFTAENSGTGYRCFQVLATVDSVLQWFWPGNVSPFRAIGAVRSSSRNVNAFNRTPNVLNQIAPFIPLSLYVERAVGNIYSYVGDVLDMRWVNLANNSPKDEIPIGGDTWKLFPVISKQPFGGATAATNNYGFAFRKNA